MTVYFIDDMPPTTSMYQATGLVREDRKRTLYSSGKMYPVMVIKAGDEVVFLKSGKNARFTVVQASLDAHRVNTLTLTPKVSRRQKRRHNRRQSYAIPHMSSVSALPGVIISGRGGVGGGGGGGGYAYVNPMSGYMSGYVYGFSSGINQQYPPSSLSMAAGQYLWTPRPNGAPYVGGVGGGSGSWVVISPVEWDLDLEYGGDPRLTPQRLAVITEQLTNLLIGGRRHRDEAIAMLACHPVGFVHKAAAKLMVDGDYWRLPEGHPMR